jgi:hypothetical protein
MSSQQGWIGVDLDGTLAHYDGWKGADHIGEPIPAMVERVKLWLAEGREVRIFTARIYPIALALPSGPAPVPEGQRATEAFHALCAIGVWLEKHIGKKLPVTCTKDYGMIELWDDRAVRVVLNTGEPCCK